MIDARHKRRTMALSSSVCFASNLCSSSRSMKLRLLLYAANSSFKAWSSRSVLTRPVSRSALTMLARSRTCFKRPISVRAWDSLSRQRCSASSMNSILSSAAARASLVSASSLVRFSFCTSSSWTLLSSSVLASLRSSISSAIRSTVSRLSVLSVSSASPPSAALFFSSSFRLASSSVFVPRTMPARRNVFFVATFDSRGYTGQPQWEHSTHFGSVSGSASAPSGD
mmetsp:Transcript_101047/g.290832  ORF Transcript_101047/g.290832 Transcript_101047/m.290832 type:complete len:226 (-) Transcript_101047:293-970(-)